VMVPLHRHQLVRLRDGAWRRILARPWDDLAQDCLAHWAEQRLPLVVTRQPAGAAASDEIAAALAAPLRWERRRIALSVPRTDVAWFDEFPRADKLPGCAAVRTRHWQRLCLALKSVGAAPRVYGSHGWQLMTGLPYVHARSDIDLWIAVSDAAHADAVAAVLGAFDAEGEQPRIDGELVFPGGRAAAWREWCTWRAGGSRSILAKTLRGPMLISSAPATAGRPSLEASAW
jgi:phosphoribosyl-dephospho-CoA transferase